MFCSLVGKTLPKLSQHHTSQLLKHRRKSMNQSISKKKARVKTWIRQNSRETSQKMWRRSGLFDQVNEVWSKVWGPEPCHEGRQSLLCSLFYYSGKILANKLNLLLYLSGTSLLSVPLPLFLGLLIHRAPIFLELTHFLQHAYQQLSYNLKKISDIRKAQRWVFLRCLLFKWRQGSPIIG